MTAAAFAGPAIFEVSWHRDAFSCVLIILNFPGILLTRPNFPPEGYPGQDLLRATLMFMVQAILWYGLITLTTLIMSAIVGKGANKGLPRDVQKDARM